METLAIVCALLANFCALVTIRLAIQSHTAEVRAIAEQEAEERRSRGISTGITVMNAMGKEATR